MKKIMTPAQITAITAKVDGSVRLSITTPELTPEEKVEIMKLQNININAYFIPTEEPEVEKIKIKGEIGQKTPSQRMRSVIYKLWIQDGSPETADIYYAKRMEKILDLLKQQIEQ
jgi:hypothetical protein